MKRPFILLDAVPFCYGPVSTLISIVNCLPKDQFELVLLASGTTEEFACAEKGKYRLVSCNTEVIEELESVKELFARCDLFISNTNPISARYAMDLGCRVAYVDTLFWMWEAIDAVVTKADAYIVQDFAGVEENRSRIGREIKNFHKVGPLIDVADSKRREKENLCIVSFGGQESNYSSGDLAFRFSKILSGIIIRCFDAIGYDGFISFRGRSSIMQRLSQCYTGNNYEFRFVPHREHVQDLNRAQYHLLSPGLTGMFEAIALNIPSLLLPGQNYSQQLQAHMLLSQRHRLFGGVEWGGIYHDGNVPAFLPELEGVEMVAGLITRFESDSEAQQRYMDVLSKTLGKQADIPITNRMQSGAAQAAEIVCDMVGVEY